MQGSCQPCMCTFRWYKKNSRSRQCALTLWKALESLAFAPTVYRHKAVSKFDECVLIIARMNWAWISNSALSGKHGTWREYTKFGNKCWDFHSICSLSYAFIVTDWAQPRLADQNAHESDMPFLFCDTHTHMMGLILIIHFFFHFVTAELNSTLRSGLFCCLHDDE